MGGRRLWFLLSLCDGLLAALAAAAFLRAERSDEALSFALAAWLGTALVAYLALPWTSRSLAPRSLPRALLASALAGALLCLAAVYAGYLLYVVGGALFGLHGSPTGRLSAFGGGALMGVAVTGLLVLASHGLVPLAGALVWMANALVLRRWSAGVVRRPE